MLQRAVLISIRSHEASHNLPIFLLSFLAVILSLMVLFTLYDSDEDKYTSSMVPGSRNPMWGEEFNFSVDELPVEVVVSHKHLGLLEIILLSGIAVQSRNINFVSLGFLSTIYSFKNFEGKTDFNMKLIFMK